MRMLTILLKALYYRLVLGPQEIVCLVSPMGEGGTELQYRLLIEGWRSRGVSCVAATAGRIENGEESHLKAPAIDFGNLTTKAPLAFIFRLLGAKILYLFKPESAVFAGPAKSAGLRVIYHETGLPRTGVSYWKPLIPRLGWVDHVVAVCPQSLAGFRSVLGYSGPGTVLTPMIHSPPAGLKCRTPEPKEVRFVYFGRLHRLKGLDELILAFAQVARTHPGFRLTLIGQGPEREKLEALTHALRISERVEFCGRLDPGALWEKLARSDVFCLPSYTEGNPCSIPEAMSLGLPVIATNVGGIPDWIEHQGNGWLVPPADVPALANALVRLGMDLDLRSRLSKAAIRRYSEVPDAEFTFETLESIFRMDSPAK